jgi:hypothetical protein
VIVETADRGPVNALGLLATEHPGPAIRIAKKYLRSIPETLRPVSESEDAGSNRVGVHFRERQIIVDVGDHDLEKISMHNFVPRMSGTPALAAALSRPLVKWAALAAE